MHLVAVLELERVEVPDDDVSLRTEARGRVRRFEFKIDPCNRFSPGRWPESSASQKSAGRRTLKPW